METDSIKSDLKRRKIIKKCLELVFKLEKLKGELEEKREKNLRLKQQLEEKLAESGERPERDGHQQEVVRISDCWVDVFEVGSGQEERPEVGQRNGGQENQAQNSDYWQCQHPGCGRRYKTKNCLYQHRNIHTTKYQCQDCQKCFQGLSQLQNHLRTHTNERPFACGWDGCGQRFRDKSKLKIHIKQVHSDDRPFRCHHKGCLKMFKRSDSLQVHLQIHSASRPFNCQLPGCSKTYKLKRHLNQHLKRVHYDSKLFYCRLANFRNTFESELNLNN